MTPNNTLCLQTPNGRSKPFKLLDMLKCACRLNFTFFWIFFGFIQMGTKIQRSEYSDFVKYLINSKKIQKNVKFDLQVTLNISIILNGLDRLFGVWNFENGPCHAVSPKNVVIRSLLIYIANIKTFVPELPCKRLVFWFLKSKWSIRAVHLVQNINICLETKFYIFWNFFAIY